MLKKKMKVALALTAMASAQWALAAELPDGSVISKANLDKVKSDTFMGHKIGDLLTEKMEWEIRNFNRTFPLTKAPDLPADPKAVEATRKYASSVKFDPQTREMTGYQAGVPFPTVSESEPGVGEKIMWNYYYGGPNFPGDQSCDVDMLTFNKSGFESSQKWAFLLLRNRGLLNGSSTTLDGGDWMKKQFFVARAPQDIKGTGTFTIFYDVPNKIDDTFVYVKSARRTRRLTGNAWMDPAGPGFDFLNDDVAVYNSRPSRYQSNKLIGKRWILASVSMKVTPDASKVGTAGEFPHISSKEAPYWNPVVPFTPREVYVVEATPPSEHPYSKKVIYVDAKLWNIYRGEIYDKKGDFWRVSEFFFTGKKGKTTGFNYVNPDAGYYVDYKLQHATHFVAPCVMDPGQKPTRFAVEQLETFQ